MQRDSPRYGTHISDLCLHSWQHSDYSLLLERKSSDRTLNAQDAALQVETSSWLLPLITQRTGTPPSPYERPQPGPRTSTREDNIILHHSH